jgi:MarR family transcriptional regulator, organic hydroperoxide resistance regulator
MNAPDVRAVQRFYPQIYFACHVDHVRQRSNAHRLSSHDSGVLSHLDEQRAVTPTALARHLQVVPSTLSAQLDRLVRLEYVARERHGADRRRWELRLTPRGARAVAAASVLDTRRVAKLLSGLTAAERKRAIDGMGLLARAALELAPRRKAPK